MNRHETLDFLKKNKQFLSEKFGVKRIAIFGSVSKNAQTIESDIDVFVELNEPKFDFYIGLQLFLEKALKSPVDLVRKGPHLSARFLSSIEKDLIYA